MTGHEAEPEWGPLEALLPEPWWKWWMWMGCVDHLVGNVMIRIQVYKHYITRKSLHLAFDDAGRVVAFQYPGYQEVDVQAEVDRVYEDIGLFNATPEGYL